jgi:16S rRNA (cytosine967-C5)-methyltransferase
VGTDQRPARSSARTSWRAPESARGLALRVVRRVTEERAYSNLTVAAELGQSTLSARDRQFAADLAYGTLRKLLVLDRAIATVSSRPPESVDAPALALLRLGTYQLMFTRVPPHAAVSETVEMAGARHKGFVNAILRRLAAAHPELPMEEDDGAISARTGLAEWAVGELRRVLPEKDVEAAASAIASPADLSLRANPCRATRDRLASRLRSAGFDPTAGMLHPEVLHLRAAVPTLLPGYEEGWFAVQDEGSAVIAAALGARAGETVLDACAGPGGKTTQLACAMGESGLLVAADVSARRAGLVRRAAGRLGVVTHALVQDARHPALRSGFDAVLVDAPCSGLGAARRRPELLWRPRHRDLARLARLQVAILVGVAGLVRPGGRLVYAVCTFPRAETEAAVRAFLSKLPDFEPMEIPGPDGPATSHRLWPHRHHTDAMFYAGLRRRP